MNGRGVYRYADGKLPYFFHGALYLSRSLFTYLDPFSSHIYSLGAIYDGFWKDQKKEGRGFYKWITGENQ